MSAPRAAAHLTAICAIMIAAAWAATAYTNHTVGGTAGWLFDSATNKSAADYSKWAAGQSFSLGDFLIFNTNTNQTVVQTYNETTYTLCTTADDDSSNDTLIFGSGVAAFSRPMTIAVPLTVEDDNFFFSEANDGVQCQHGMRFQIKVARGSGLPPSLNQPPPPPYTLPPTAEPPPVFQGSGGGQGESIYNGCAGWTGNGFMSAAFVAVVVLLGFGSVV